MTTNRKIRVGLVWSQFASHHIDRAEAVAKRLKDRASVIAVEVASSSLTYAELISSNETAWASQATLFPGQIFEVIPRWRRACALIRHLADFQLVCIGIGYNEYEVLLVVLVLRLIGVQVIMMNDSKFDDRPRSANFEFAKRIVLGVYSGAIVASARSVDYVRFLGFRTRPVLVGVDGVSLDRIRGDARTRNVHGKLKFTARKFVFVGRFVDVKNLPFLIEAYALYVQLAGVSARDLVLIGSGPLETQLRDQVSQADLDGKVDFVGFCIGPILADYMAGGLALLLVSLSETWGLVVNEAAGLGLPVIATEIVGARDALVRTLINGVIVENGSSEGLAAAMKLIADDEARWNTMSAAATARAWMGDVEPFADAIELLLDPAAAEPRHRMSQHLAQFEQIWGQRRI